MTSKVQVKQDPEVNDASSSHFFIFHFFTTFSFFHSPHRSFLHVAPFSASILPPRPSFLLVPPSSSALLPARPSLFLVQHCINYSESVKGHFSSILTKALRTNQRTDQPTNGRMNKASYRDARMHLKTTIITTVCLDLD